MSVYLRFIRIVSLAAIALATAYLAANAVQSTRSAAAPDEPVSGRENQLTVIVPNESDSESTVRVELAFPTAIAITSVRTAPSPGWKADVIRREGENPMKPGGAAQPKAVRSVIWTAEPGMGIPPGQFGMFQLLTGSLPFSGDVLSVPATTTYSDGGIVQWNQTPADDGTELEHPAPIVKITELTTHAHDSNSAPQPDNTARWMAGLGLLIAAIGLGLGVKGIVADHRRRTRSTQPPDETMPMPIAPGEHDDTLGESPSAPSGPDPATR